MGCLLMLLNSGTMMVCLLPSQPAAIIASYPLPTHTLTSPPFIVGFIYYYYRWLEL